MSEYEASRSVATSSCNAVEIVGVLDNANEQYLVTNLARKACLVLGIVQL